ncbi:MAG: putative rane protein [Blastocatellia bacterium]|jgi:putative membrane protein|nr:putative rane protein [Blastocatellia bacterium]
MRNKIILTAGIAAVSLALLAGCGGANTNDANTATRNGANLNGNANAATSTPRSSAALGDDDRKFMTNAATGGMEEVELGRLAAGKAQSADVKKFGQKMVDDHSQANTELKQLAARKGVTLPAGMMDDQKADKDKLSKLSGAEFDREYMKMMVDDHDKDVKEFKDEADDGSDADLKSFAAKTLPTLQEHQRMAKDIKGKQ